MAVCTLPHLHTRSPPRLRLCVSSALSAAGRVVHLIQGQRVASAFRQCQPKSSLNLSAESTISTQVDAGLNGTTRSISNTFRHMDDIDNCRGDMDSSIFLSQTPFGRIDDIDHHDGGEGGHQGGVVSNAFRLNRRYRPSVNHTGLQLWRVVSNAFRRNRRHRHILFVDIDRDIVESQMPFG